MAMSDKRQTPAATLCNWCFKVTAGGRWLTERRKKAKEAYETVICSRCASFFFGGKVPADLDVADS